MQVDTGGIMASEMPHIPPEVLQTIFRNLDFYDLLRCQQVCKTWRAYLPGNDQKLRRRLFMNYPRAEDHENNDDNDDTDVDEDSDDYKTHRADELSRTSDFCPNFVIPLRTIPRLVRYHKSLPFVSFRTKFDLDGSIVRRTSLGSSHAVYHPILRNLKNNMHLFNKHLFTTNSGKPKHWFDFKTLKNFRTMTQKVKSMSAQKDGSWKDMLICVPPPRWATVTFEHGPHQQHKEKHVLYAEGKGGVTLGQFAELLCEELRSMEGLLRSYQFNERLRCPYCEDKECDCL